MGVSKVTMLPAVMELHRCHPEYCSKEVALLLNMSWGHVRVIGSLKHLKFAKTAERKRYNPALKTKDYKP